MTSSSFAERIKPYRGVFSPVVPYQEGDVLVHLDFTDANTEITGEILKDTGLFTRYITTKLTKAGALYGIGGYAEHRTIYSRSAVFDAKEGEEPRRFHRGNDIWGKPYTKVMAPLDGIVHSFAFNNAFGDYGATIILVHQLEGMTFYTLYGHLSLNSLKNLQEGQNIRKGDVFTEFGIPFENGQWPPHLHFQVILDMQGHKGDYPGVCAFSPKESYLENCPDPDLLLDLVRHSRRG